MLHAFAVAVIALIVRGWVLPTLERMDKADTEVLVSDAQHRVLTALDSHQADLSRTCEDWAAWDSMYAFAGDPVNNKKFRDENFEPDTIASLGLSRCMLLDENGKLIVSADYDHIKAAPAQFGWPDGAPEFIARADPSRESRGVIVGPDGRPSFYSFKSVRTSGKEGPHRGFLLMIRPLTNDDLVRIGAVTGTTLAVEGLSSTDTLQRVAQTPRSSAELKDAQGRSVIAITIGVDDNPLRDAHRARDEMLTQAGLALALVWLASVVVITARNKAPARPAGAVVGTQLKPTLGAAAFAFGIAGLAVLIAHRWEHQQIDAELRRRATNFDALMTGSLQRELDEVGVVAAALTSTHTQRADVFARMIDLLARRAPLGEGYLLLRQESQTAIDSISTTAPPVNYPALVQEPEFAEAVQRACDGGVPVISAPIATTSDNGPIVILLLAAPVYDAGKPRDLIEQRRQAHVGTVVAVLDSAVAVPELIGPFRGGNVAWSLAAPGNLRLAASGDTGLLGHDAEIYGKIETTSLIGGQPLGLRFIAGTGFAPGSGWLAPAVGILGMSIAALVTAMVAGFTRRAAVTELLVAQRTAELQAANRDLEAASIRAQSANRAKSEFLAHMSHEIRTPMTAILGYAELMQDENAGDIERRECVATIRRSGEHLLTIINDILDFSKVEAGKIEIERMACSPRSIAADVESIMRARALEKGLTLRVEIDPSVPQAVWTDPTRVRQVLMNLVGNAVKFTNQGSIRVALRGHNLGPLWQLTFSVTDSGIGMDDAALARLFQPFSQADSSMSRRFGGTGLGLAISRRLAQLLGGDLSVTSKPGVGSTFEFIFTTAEADAAQLPQPFSTPHPTVSAAQPARLTGLRILLAEDGHDNQRLIRTFLTREGANVTLVENGRDALNAALQAKETGQPFHIVLMDVQMPMMDGYTATRTLRTAGYSGPILALTAHALQSDYEASLAAGCNDHLTKPINKTKLITACGMWARTQTDQLRNAA